MLTSRIIGAVAFTWLASAAVSRAESPSLAVGQEEQDARLENQLSRLDKVASLYRDTALKFSCREQITYHPATPSVKVYDLEYMYVYDKQKGLVDYRNEIRAGGKRDKVPREISLAELGLPSVVLRAYSMIFIFERAKYANYRYDYVKNEKVLGRDAMVIRFEAVPPYKEDYNDWFGQAWVDLETAQLLKVEALKANQYEESQKMEADLAGNSSDSDRSGHDYFIEKILTEFSVEHHGMRFPSRVLIRRTRFHVGQREATRVSTEHPVFWVEQMYSNYNFYGVRAYEQIRDFVGGPESLEKHP